jgi:hypothetical protein
VGGGDPGPAPAPPEDSTPECFAQLKDRPITNPAGQALGGMHAFWWVQDANGQQWIISGENNGSLDAKVVSGSANGLDNSSKTTVYNSGLSAMNCDSVALMLAGANLYANTLNGKVNYHWYGPNSNSFADFIGQLGNIYLPQPTGALGWNDTGPIYAAILGITHN